MIDPTKLLTIAIEAGALISSLAAIVAAIIMLGVTRKFGTGILANGFKVDFFRRFLYCFGNFG